MSGDWDDHLEPEQRSATIDYTRQRLGLSPRGGNFAVGATEARQPSPRPVMSAADAEVFERKARIRQRAHNRLWARD